MPTKRYRVTNNSTGESKVIDWDGEVPPTSQDVENYFKNSQTPINSDNQKDNYSTIRKYYEQVKDVAGRAFESLNKPVLPERNFGESSDYYPFKSSSILGNVNVPSAGKVYDNVRDLSSPVGIASTLLPFAHAFLPKGEVKPEEALTSPEQGKYQKVSEISKPKINEYAIAEEATGTEGKPKFVEPEEATYNRMLENKGGTQKSTALVKVGEQGLKKYETVGPPEPKKSEAPRLAGFQNSGDGIVYLQFDRNGIDVTPEQVRAMFPDKNIEVIKFRENILSPHIQKFRIDTDSKTAKAMEESIGGNFHDWDRAFKEKMGGSFSEVVGGQNQEPKDITPNKGGEPPNEPPNSLTKFEPLEGPNPKNYGEFPDEWADYVNARKAGQLEGQYTGKQFSYLDVPAEEGIGKAEDIANAHPINLLQQNLKEGNFPEVREYLDNIYKELNEAGVDTAYKEDYLPQMWDNSPDEISAAFGKRLGLKPSFTYESFFKDYQEGIDKGLTPKFNNPSELLNAYTSYARKAIADRKFFNYLQDTGQIQTSKPGSDWKPLSGEFFPTPWKDRTYYAEPNTARLLNNYFSNPEQGSWGEIGIKNAADLSGKLTRTVLGFHLPGTAWSIHGINTTIARSLFGEDLNPLKAVGRLGESAYYLSRPQAAENLLNNNPVSAINAVRDGGLEIGRWSSDIGKPLISGDSLAAKGLNFLTNPKPLFQQFIPAMMLKDYEAELAELQRKGIDYKSAAKRAGINVNNTFGVLNREQSTNPLVFDKTLNNIKRTFLLAPNWLESRIGLAKGTADALLDPNNPMGRKYLSGVSNFMASYVALNVMNALVHDGKTMLQNEPGKELSLAVGKDSKGKTIYINPYAGAIDFIKVPLAIAHSALEGNFSETTKDARSKMSEPSQFAIDLLSNTDWKQSPILGNKGNYGRPQSAYEQVGNLANDTASHFLPLGIEGGVNALEGKISPEEAAARVLQLPLSFKSEPKGRRVAREPREPRIP